MIAYLQQLNALRNSVSGRESIKYTSVQFNAVVLLDEVKNGVISKAVFDREVKHLGILLQNNRISDEAALSWIKEASAASKK
jgi:hypothetical protein